MSKKFLIGMAVLLSASLFFLGCGGDDGDDAGGGNEDKVPPVSDLELTGHVSLPVTGQPATISFDADQYAGEVSWSADLDGANFAASTDYTATVTLTAKPGRTFDGFTAGTGTFTYIGAKSPVANKAVAANGTVEVTIVFPITLKEGGALNDVTETDLTARVTKPETGVEAKTSGTDQYGVAVKWTPDLPEDGKFAAKTAYTAEVTLAPAENYTFEGFAGTFSYDGADSVAQAVAGDTVVVTIGFIATGGSVDEPGPVSALDLSGAIAAPVAGETPSGVFTSPAGSQYTGGTVTWDPLPADGKFAAGTEYTAAVTLAVEPGYTFEGAGGFIYGDLAVTATPNEDFTETAVTVAFGSTDLAVTATTLTGAIAAPVTGAEPDYVFTTPSAAQYDGGAVAWTPAVAEGGTFAAGTVYKAEVTLAPVEGYTLAGAVFTYAGATVALAGDVVTVTFGATDAVVGGSALDLSKLLAAPAKNGTPAPAIDGAQYAGNVVWKDAGDKDVGTQFGAATGYTATAVLAPLPGYTFTGFAGTFVYGDLVVAQTLDEETNTVEITVTFADTDDSESLVSVGPEPAKVVSSTGSLQNITLAKGGEKVTLTVVSSSSSYTIGSAQWYLDGNTKALKGTEGVSGNTLTLDPAKYGVRDHHVTVTVKADGKSYSVTVPFKVTAAGN